MPSSDRSSALAWGMRSMSPVPLSSSPRRVLAGLVGAAMVSACGTYITETPLGDGYPTAGPRSPSSVQVFASGPPSRPYRDLAILEAEQTHGLNEQGTSLMIAELKRRAALRGCDGIVLGGIRERDGAPLGSELYLLDPGATTMHATCIVFRPQPPKAKPRARRPEAAPVLAPAAPAEPDRGSCRPP